MPADNNIINSLLESVLTRKTSRLPQDVEAMNLQRQLWENLKNEVYRPNFKLRGSSPLQFWGPTSFSPKYLVPYQEPINYTLGEGSPLKTGITSKSTPWQLPVEYKSRFKIVSSSPLKFGGPTSRSVQYPVPYQEPINYTLGQGTAPKNMGPTSISTPKQLPAVLQGVADNTETITSKAPQILKNPLLNKIAPWIAPVQSGVQAYSNEQQLREMEKWNEYMKSQGRAPMYSDEAIKAQKTRGYTASAPLASALTGGVFGGVPGLIAGGTIGELANFVGGMLPQQSGYTRAPLTGKYRGMELNQLPQFKGPNGEIITTVDQLESILNNKPIEASNKPALEEIPSMDTLPPIPEGLGKVDYTEGFINNLVATNGVQSDVPQLRGKADTTPIVEQVTPQTAYDNIYEDLLKSREKALANKIKNIEQLEADYQSDVKGLRRANLIDTLTNSLVGIANPKWQVTMPMLSGNITYGSTPNKEATPATDYIKSAPLKSEVTSTINKLKEASDQAEVDFELAQAELLDKVNIANQIGLPVSMVNKDLLKAQMDNATKEAIAKQENIRRLTIQAMMSQDKAEQRRLLKAIAEQKAQVDMYKANLLKDQRILTGLMGLQGALMGDTQGLTPFINLLTPSQAEAIQEAINQGGSEYGYGE